MDGWKFRRQAPIGPYVVDFVCFAARLVVELDGSSHTELSDDYDERRQAWLESQGFTVLRLSADNPETDPIEGAWGAIDLALTAEPIRSAPPALRATSPASGED
jgi:very-short-patch-repair endonuclease